MGIQEQTEIKEKHYNEAIRYMDNAKECLTKAQKKDDFYNDTKYVKMACGTAYNGLLIALDGFLLLKGIQKPKGKARKSIEYYQKNLASLDRKALNCLNSAYKVLHLSGYYDGIEDAIVVRRGFDDAYAIIEKIKP
jgi:uncharacterized protein (UPF0332 family)